MNYSEPAVLSPYPDPLPKGEGVKLYLPKFPCVSNQGEGLSRSIFCTPYRKCVHGKGARLVSQRALEGRNVRPEPGEASC